MKHWPIYLLLLSLLGQVFWIIYWRQNQTNKTPTFYPFDVNFQVTEESLYEDGYQLIPEEDVPIVVKSKGDTLIYYQFYYACPQACEDVVTGWRNYVFTSDQLDSLELVSFIEANDGLIYPDWKYSEGTFWVRHIYNQVMFQCFIDSTKEGKYKFQARCYFPFTDRDMLLEIRNKEKELNNAP